MPLVNCYATLAQLRTELGNYAAADTSDDSSMEIAINAASRQIDGHCGRRFWVDGSVVAREFEADSARCCYVDDISTVTGLVVKIDTDANGTFETTLTITTDFLVLPFNAADMVPVRPFDEIRLVDNYSFPVYGTGRPGVQVTAKFGWPAVPDDITKACLIQAADLFKAKDAVFGVAGISEMGVLRVRASLSPLAKALVDPYALPCVG